MVGPTQNSNVGRQRLLATATVDQQPMRKFPPILLIFPALAVLFLCLTVLDVLRHGPKLSPASKVWLRIGLIFAAVSVYLFLSQRPSS